MKNYWLDKVKEKNLVTERWILPTSDEDWYPIRQVCAEVGEEMAKELEVPGLTITVSDQGWKNIELQSSCCGYFSTEGPVTPDFVVSNVPSELNEEEYVRMQKLEALKLEILSQNPSGLMIPVPDTFSFDISSEYDAEYGYDAEMEILARNQTASEYDETYDYGFDL